jgi:3-hydroxybutyryl-CoA dehydratase
MRQPPSVSHAVTQATIDAYAELSGDYNPLHMDPEYAARIGFDSTIAHGPLGLQAFFELLSRWLDVEAPPPGTRLEVVYTGPVPAGSTVTAEAEAQPTEDGTALDGACRIGERTVAAVKALIPRR